MRLECAMLFVKDLERLRAFYAAALGAEPVNTEWTESWALFEAGGAQFALHAIAAESAGAVRIDAPPRPRETAPVKLIFAVTDVQAEKARLAALGATPIPRDWQQNDEACDFADPEGNVFQIKRT